MESSEALKNPTISLTQDYRLNQMLEIQRLQGDYPKGDELTDKD